jgi:hypothetical protein
MVFPHLQSGIGVRFSIEPALPHALLLNTSTGMIHGILDRDTHMPEHQWYILSAKNNGGMVTCQLVLSLDMPATTTKATTTTTPKQAASLNYGARLRYGDVPRHFHPGEEVELRPQFIGGQHARYSVNPPLPDDLTLDTSTGEIHGHLKEVKTVKETTYVITAHSKAGNASRSVSFDVVSKQVMKFSYGDVPRVFRPNTAVVLMPHIASDNTGERFVFSVTPSLPPHLTIDESTGEIEGTLASDVETEMTDYVITATDASGSKSTAQISFAVKPRGNTPTMSYSPVPDEFEVRKKYKLVPEVSGFKPVNFSIEPELPVGLVLHEDTGVIQGEFESHQPPQTYIITGWGKEAAYGDRVRMADTKIHVLFRNKAFAFPWMLVIAALAVIGLVVFGCYQYRNSPARKDDTSSYVALRQQPQEKSTAIVPYEADNKKVELTFQLPDTNEERTVVATRKPLGLKYPSQLPIKITQESRGHGKQLGIGVGWTLIRINGADAFPGKTERHFKQVQQDLHEAMSALPHQ